MSFGLFRDGYIACGPVKGTLYLQQQRGNMRCKSANWRETVMRRLVYRNLGRIFDDNTGGAGSCAQRAG